ncbi:MFS general substrate transporter [Aulographum hederae CBS 113979]|uniref:MFS general substrate transporter n=1 Tax=Aulographum hederae CBS 113979 TaxID=1176131 RepID=A0A6G1GYW2_9PEZI|nr:MFS general substrate transporter [Aulographum hederae CBS 113979]
MDTKMYTEKAENVYVPEEENNVENPGDGGALTRSVLLKLDTRLLPVLALLFLCSFLDRTNVGNAKILGMEADLEITDKQYSIGLAVFYASYIVREVPLFLLSGFELPSNLIIKKVSPKIWLPALTFVWGVVTMCLGFVQGFGSFVAVRLILGMCEGGLLPGMVLYLSTFYKRSELALRIGLFYTAASLSGAFGGLLARGLSAIGPRGGLEGWRWILIIEGLLTVACGTLSYFLLPNNVESAKFLSTAQKDCARQRLNSDAPGNSRDSFLNGNPEESFQWSEVRRGVFNIQVWLSASAYFSILAGLYSFGLFLPTIINALGFVDGPDAAQLWSVIPYAVACIFTVITAYASDRYKLRGVLMLFCLPVSIVGYAVIANVSNAKVKYGMTFLMATGMYSAVPCVLVWNSNNSAGHYKRATTSALQLAIANSGGFVATFAYPKTQSPQFHKGHTTMLGLLVAAWFLVLLNVLHCWKINRDKDNGKYDEFRGCGDDRDPNFRMVL